VNDKNEEEYVWATSWGVSTRLVGGLIMAHSDDSGLVLPPKLAPTQVAIVPIPKPAPEIGEVAEKIMKALRDKGISVKYDKDDQKRPGFKFAEHEMRGVPVRLGIGKRDLEKGQVEVARRDTKEKSFVPLEGIAEYVGQLLDDIQQNLFNRAKKFREENTTKIDSFDDFKAIVETPKEGMPESWGGGFLSAHWDGTTETELKIKELTKATIRCIPLDGEEEEGQCILTGKPSKRRVLFAKAY
ncbi:MAG: proline--tRNA ligase, partial [Phaeodactylibacter sp.]|nr:proline--tRNA ligase [Phaeodactylibacter sp.]